MGDDKVQDKALRVVVSGRLEGQQRSLGIYEITKFDGSPRGIMKSPKKGKNLQPYLDGWKEAKLGGMSPKGGGFLVSEWGSVQGSKEKSGPSSFGHGGGRKGRSC